MPTLALAEDWHDHDRDHHAIMTVDTITIVIAITNHKDRLDYGYNNQPLYIPPNGQGIVNERNPNLYWACDSEGHHCHWAPRR